ncbi:MAG: Na(+)-translocating NADH-quinone reductase subunit A [Lentisphaeria bacterium]
MADFRLKEGYDIPLVGGPADSVSVAPRPATVALKPSEFRGVKIRLLVDEGDVVKAGSPLGCVKNREQQIFTAPTAGTVMAVVRGPRRALMEVVIKPDEASDAVPFKQHDAVALSGLSRDVVLEQLLQSGLFNVFQQRPFGNVADPAVTPRSIFVSAFDTAPLSADTALIVQGNEAAFQAGLDIASRLASGKVHLSVDGRRLDLPKAFSEANNVELHRFSGPHPTGCVGVQIHHVDPIKHRRDVVWTTTVQGLILIGRLFLEGRYVPDITVALSGSAVTAPKHYRTVVGANIASITNDNVKHGDLRYISGDVLTGTTSSPDGHLDMKSSTLTVIPEATESEFLGWALPGFGRLSKYRTYPSAVFGGKRFAPDTKLNGGHRAFLATGYYEQVLPMDIYPMYLLKSILAQDFDEMEGLGILEVTEEEFALCEYACPSKVNVQQIIRDGLDLVEYDG